jgi:hypothetical protein
MAAQTAAAAQEAAAKAQAEQEAAAKASAAPPTTPGPQPDDKPAQGKKARVVRYISDKDGSSTAVFEDA